MYVDETGIFYRKMNTFRRDKEFKAKIVTGTVNLNEQSTPKRIKGGSSILMHLDVGKFYVETKSLTNLIKT